MRMRLTASVLAAWCLACDGGHVSIAERCERVRDRLVELEIPRTDPDREAHARVMRRAMGNAFLERCTRAMTDAQRDCVLDARHSQDASRCISGPNQPARPTSVGGAK